MRTNPVYRKMVEDALDKRVTEAELNVRLDEEREQVNREAAENLYSTIVETAKQYPGVDPERVRQIYAKGLVSGDIKEITEESIHQVYKQEADYTSRIVSATPSRVDRAQDPDRSSLEREGRGSSQREYRQEARASQGYASSGSRRQRDSGRD
jgi:hypothetical protein